MFPFLQKVLKLFKKHTEVIAQNEVSCFYSFIE